MSSLLAGWSSSAVLAGDAVGTWFADLALVALFAADASVGLDVASLAEVAR